MDTFIELQLKTGGIIAVSVLLFAGILAKDHFFNRNRAWLLATLIVPWIVPLMAMPVWLKSVFYKPEVAAQPLVLTMDVPITYGEAVVVPEPINWMQIGLSIYAVVSLLMVVRLIWGYAFIHRLKKSGQHQYYKGYDVVLLNDKGVNPFSFFRTIYLPHHLNRDANRQMILEHERNHCAQLHSIDISLAEWLLIIQWWNPFVWWLRKLIAQNHEYCVDNAMVHTTCEPMEYQYSLLSLLQGHRQMQLVNDFNQSLTKKRLVMMNKKHTNTITGWVKGVLVLPLVVATMLAFTNPDKTLVKPVDRLEISDALSLRRYFAMNIKYPVKAQEAGTQGIVTVNFKVDKKGKVSDVSIGSNTAATQLDKVVVVGYAATEGQKQMGDRSKDEHLQLLKNEVKRVVEAMPEVTDVALKGKLLQVDFEFMLQKCSKGQNEEVSSMWEGRKTQLVNSKGEAFTLLASGGHIELDGPATNRPEFVLDGKLSTWEEIAALDLSDVGAIGKSPAGLHVKTLDVTTENGAFIIHTKRFIETLKRSSVIGSKNPKPSLYIVDGKAYSGAINDISPSDIAKVNVLKGDAATKKYGEKAKDGAFEITTKSGLKEDTGHSALIEPEVTALYGDVLKNSTELLTSKGNEEKVIFQSSGKSQVSISDLSITDSNGESPLFIVDGRKQKEANVNAENIDKVSVIKGEMALDKYGEEGKNGVVLIETKAAKKAEELVVLGYGTMNKPAISKQNSHSDQTLDNVLIKGASADKKPRIILDGKEFHGNINEINSDEISSVYVMKGEAAIDQNGEKAPNGVIMVTTKAGAYSAAMAAAKPLFQSTGKVKMTELNLTIEDESGESPLYIVNGKKQDGLHLDREDIKSISILKREKAIQIYGEEGKNGVVLISTKDEQ
ncbi:MULTISPECIES: TonB family protein [unclassified Carboxylicivirga]|uniref:TonB family protein n=1 Tax=Carboxylicivirga TaxID=1628153 RepID=UPI003D352E0B